MHPRADTKTHVYKRLTVPTTPSVFAPPTGPDRAADGAGLENEMLRDADGALQLGAAESEVQLKLLWDNQNRHEVELGDLFVKLGDCEAAMADARRNAIEVVDLAENTKFKVRALEGGQRGWEFTNAANAKSDALEALAAEAVPTLTNRSKQLSVAQQRSGAILVGCLEGWVVGAGMRRV